MSIIDFTEIVPTNRKCFIQSNEKKALTKLEEGKSNDKFRK